MKSITDIRAGAANIKSARSIRARSAPKSKDSAYLDIFLLNKEKARLKQEQYVLGKRQEQNRKRLEEIEASIELAAMSARELEGNLERGESLPSTAKPPPGKKWHTMPLSY